jgi:hypothetical protein
MCVRRTNNGFWRILPDDHIFLDFLIWIVVWNNIGIEEILSWGTLSLLVWKWLLRLASLVSSTLGSICTLEHHLTIIGCLGILSVSNVGQMGYRSSSLRLRIIVMVTWVSATTSGVRSSLSKQIVIEIFNKVFLTFEVHLERLCSRYASYYCFRLYEYYLFYASDCFECWHSSVLCVLNSDLLACQADSSRPFGIEAMPDQ